MQSQSLSLRENPCVPECIENVCACVRVSVCVRVRVCVRAWQYAGVCVREFVWQYAGVCVRESVCQYAPFQNPKPRT